SHRRRLPRYRCRYQQYLACIARPTRMGRGTRRRLESRRSLASSLQLLGDAVFRPVLRSFWLLLLLAGCVTSSAPERWTTLPASERGAPFGTIAAEVSTRYTLNSYRIQYRNLATGEVGTLALAPQNSRMFPPIGDTGDPERYVKGKTIGRLFEVSPAGRR